MTLELHALLFLSVFTEIKLMSKNSKTAKENRKKKIDAQIHAAILSLRFIYGLARRTRRKRTTRILMLFLLRMEISSAWENVFTGPL